MGPMLTVDDVAAILKLSPITVYRELVKRRIPGFKVGNQWRARQDILEEWMEEQSGWMSRFDRLWIQFQKKGRKRRLSEGDVAAEVRASRKGRR